MDWPMVSNCFMMVRFFHAQRELDCLLAAETAESWVLMGPAVTSSPICWFLSWPVVSINTIHLVFEIVVFEYRQELSAALSNCWLPRTLPDVCANWSWVSTLSTWCLRSLSLNTDKNSPLLFQIVVLEYSHFTLDVLCGSFRTLCCGCFRLSTRTLSVYHTGTPKPCFKTFDLIAFLGIKKNLMIFQLQEVWGY